MSDDYFEGMAIGAAIMTIVGLLVMVMSDPKYEPQPQPASHKGDRLVPHYMQNVARDGFCWPHFECSVI